LCDTCGRVYTVVRDGEVKRLVPQGGSGRGGRRKMTEAEQWKAQAERERERSNVILAAAVKHLRQADDLVARMAEVLNSIPQPEEENDA
jgi:hypothetical protein